VGYENFEVFEIAGEPFLSEEGCPAVPQIRRFYRIPNTGGVDLVIERADYDVLDNIHPLPFHDASSKSDAPTRNSRVYSADAWYPAQVAQISAPMQLRDFRVVTFTLYPVQVNPVHRQARVHHDIAVGIVSNGEPSKNEILHPRGPSGAWAQIYRSVIANLDEGALDDATHTPGSYLILADIGSTVRPWVDSLATWKKRLGYEVIVDARGNWTVASMRTRIQSLYASADPPLEYVALMGDPYYADGVPTSYTDLDHYFALGNNGDDLEDISVGRLCGGTMSEMAVINAKLRSYERDPWMQDIQGNADTSWFHSGAFYGGSAGESGDARNLIQWASSQFASCTGVWNNHVGTYRGSYINEGTVRAWFASGISFFIMRGSWIGQIGRDFPLTLPPSWRLPVVVVIAEGTGNFNGELGMSEAFLTAGTPINPRGGVCAIGTAWAYNYAPATPLTAGLVYNVANLGVEQIGLCLMGAKLQVALTFGVNSPTTSLMFRSANLMGEPAMHLWTDVPRVMTVAHPDSLAIGTPSVQISVQDARTAEPVQDALVVLWKGSETYARGLTDEQGMVTLPVRVDSSGTMLLTVSKHNHKPYLFDIPCSRATRYVAMSSYALSDSTSGGTHGNGDHQPNPSETMDLAVALRNHSTSDTARGISATLSSASPNVTVIHAVASYPALTPGDSALGNAPFRIQVSPQMRHLETALLTDAATADGQTTQSAIWLTCLAGELGQPLPHFSPSLEPGRTCTLSVSLRNSGALSMDGVFARLTSFSPYITVNVPIGLYGTIPVGQSVSNAEYPFVVTAAGQTIRGHVATFMLIATTATEYADTVVFTASVGQAAAHDPSGPDAFGYLAFDNTDSSYAAHPVFDYVAIDSIGTNLNLNDRGEELASDPVYSVARRLPFPFKFYDQFYDTITICSNGWCALGDQTWCGWHTNFPIPGMAAPGAMIAPYWDDLRTFGAEGLGVWDYCDSANHRYVIQWKATGAFATSTALDFEVMLLDTAAYPTPDGNGKILMQYQAVTMHLPNVSSEEPQNGCSVGIQAAGGLVGLPWVYDTAYASGAATVQPGLAILFTSEERTVSGSTTPRAEVPHQFTLHQNYPNPFNPVTVIPFDLPVATRVELRIFNTLGEEIAHLVDDMYAAGTHRVPWYGKARNGESVASGVYIYRLRAGSSVAAKKMVLIR
jgi:hypothetical protein